MRVWGWGHYYILRMMILKTRQQIEMSMTNI